MIEKDKRKPFDSTICFTFFGDWLDTIESLEKDCGEDVAYALFKAIANYSMCGEEPTFSLADKSGSIACKAVWGLLVNDIDTSISNRKRWFDKSCPTEKQKAIIDECIRRPDSSAREIADAIGVSKSSVDRVRKKYAKQIMEGIDSLKKKSEENQEESLHALRETQRVPNDDNYSESDLPF